MEKVFRQWGIPLFLSVKALRSGIYKCLQREFRIKQDLHRESKEKKERDTYRKLISTNRGVIRVVDRIFTTNYYAYYYWAA